MSPMAAAGSSPIPSRAPLSPARGELPAWLLFAAGAALLMISNGRTSVWPAAWLSPILLLRFSRDGRAGIRFPLLYLLLVAGFAVQFRGMVPIPGWGYLAFLLLNGLPGIAPYLLDRLLLRRGAGPASILAFPLGWVAAEYLYSLGIYGSWGSIAYSQYGNLLLLQLVSVTGLWGIPFLMGWLASACNGAWESTVRTGAPGKGLGICLMVLSAVFLGGGMRLVMAPADAPTVRIASLSRARVDPDLEPGVFANLLGGRASEDDLRKVRQWGAAVDDDLLARADREALSGAKIVFWGEGNAVVLKEDEAALLQRGRALARDRGIYLGMALAVWDRRRTPPLENKIVLIRPDGEAAWEFLKAHPVPGGEAAVSAAGDGKLRLSETPYGRLSAVICFDADFPRLLQQAGALRTDLLLDPSNDWQAIDPWHTQMASFRGMEQGFNLVRHTSNGWSAAFDSHGRVLSSMDHYQASERTLVSQVPIRGVRTLYSRTGDLFAWISLALLPGLALRRLVPTRPLR